MVEMTGGYLWVLPVGMSVVLAAIGLIAYVLLDGAKEDNENRP